MKRCLSLLVLVVPFVFLIVVSSAKKADDTTSAADCAPKRFSKTIVSCCGLPQFYWDGKECVDATMLPGKCGCICTGHDGTLGGKDCDAIFETREACEAAYAEC